MRTVYHFKIVCMAQLLFLGAPTFVAVSVFLVLERPYNPVAWIISSAGILFFGGCLIVGLVRVPRLIENSEALILIPQRLTICHTGKRRQDFIAWSEITALSDLYIRGQLFIMIHLRNPDRKIGREQTVFYQILMKWNMRLTGSPYSISPGSFRGDNDELFSTLEKYGRPAQDTSDEK